MSSPKENRGGFARVMGFGRGASTADGDDSSGGTAATTAVSGKQGQSSRESGQDKAPNGAAPHAGNGSSPARPGTVTVNGSARADVVNAPAVSDGADRSATKGRPADTPRPVTVPKPAAGQPSATASARTAPPSQAPSQARAQVPASTPSPAGGPEAGDAPVPKSKLGRTRTAETGRATRLRRARLKIANIDPWSVMKVSFLFSVALGVIMLVAVALLWLLLDFMGFFATVGGTVDDITGDEANTGFDVVGFFSLPRVLGMTTILALIEIVMVTALTTLAAYLYNLSTDLVGGVEVTLAEEE